MLIERMSRRGALKLGAVGALLMPVGKAMAAVDDPRRAWFEGYLNAFNAKDYDGFSAYYAENVKFHGQAATLVGRDAIVEFYTGVHKRIDEKVELINLVSREDLIAAEIRTTLIAREDWPDFPTGAFKAGDRRGTIGFVFYDIANDKFTRIRSARYARL